MADEVVVTKSPQELAKEAHEAEEARLAAQTFFDAKVHGVGTHPAMGPQNTAELTKCVMELAGRVAQLEATANVANKSNLKGSVK